MNPRPLVPAMLAALLLFGLFQPPTASQAQGQVRAMVNGVPDTGQFLPDETILARIGDKQITSGDLVDAYFSTYAEYRPKSDSTGLHELLDNMLNKEVLSRVAFEAGRPLTFEDRHELRTHEERVLSNVLYTRMVLDSIKITEDDVRDAYQQFTFESRLRQILVPDEATAAKVRLELVRGKISWRDAVKKYSIEYSEGNPDGEIGWKLRLAFDALVGDPVFRLKPGEISQPIKDIDGWHVMQCMERSDFPASSLDAMYVQIRDQLYAAEMTRRSSAFKTRLAEEVHMTYDTTAIMKIAAMFPSPRTFKDGELTLDPRIPHLSPADTGLVLARFDGGRLSAGAFVQAFEEIPAMMRPAVDHLDGMISQIQSIALEPHRIDVARRMGLDKDSLTIAQMAQKQDQMRVEHLYQDSVASKVWVSTDERRKYYEENKVGFITYPTARYVAMYTKSRPFADSLEARIEAGASAEAVLAEETARGRVTGTTQVRHHNDVGPFHKILFEELRAGETMVAGPDQGGNFIVIHVIEQDPGRQLSFEEAQGMIDQNLQNMKSEALLKELIARHRPRFDIEIKPSLLTGVRLVDPYLERKDL